MSSTTRDAGALYEVLDGPEGRVTFIDHHLGQRLVIPRAELAAFVAPPHVPAAPVPAAIEEAVGRPVAGPTLRELAGGAKRVAIIVSDSTRLVPSDLILPVVMRELAEGGVRPSQVTVVVATGVHRPATEEERSRFLGPHWSGRVAIENHDARDPGRLAVVGTTSGGNEVAINRTVWEADLRIAFGQVEPHEHAGFTGGPKSILAGVSGEDSIRRNHSPDMLLRAEAVPGRLGGNPIWEDMREAAQLAGLRFVVNVVLDPAGRIAAVSAGSMLEAHADAVRRYRELYGTSEPPADADIVVTTPGPGLDLNLYQSVKPVVASERVLRDGGVVVLSSACHEGLGGGESFLAPYEGAGSPDEVVARLRDGFRIEMDHALLLCRLQTDRRLRLRVHAPGVPEGTLRTMFLDPAPSLQDAYDGARELAGTGGNGQAVRTVIFPQAQKLVGTEVAA